MLATARGFAISRFSACLVSPKLRQWESMLQGPSPNAMSAAAGPHYLPCGSLA